MDNKGRGTDRRPSFGEGKGPGKQFSGGRDRTRQPDPRKMYEKSSGGYGHPSGRQDDRQRSGRKPPAKPGTKPKPDPNAPSSQSRRVALEIFQDVVRRDAYAALSLDDRMKNANLSQLDKRFCASIVYRTLENLLRIDYVLGFFLQDAENLEPTVRDVLRISVCQLLFHDRIPDSAVVDEAVKLVRFSGLEGLTGLTNAVLRSVIRGKDEIKYPDPTEGPRYFSIMYSVPLWLAERLTQAYGSKMAGEICAFRSDSHYTVIRPNMTRLDDAAFEKLMDARGWHFMPGTVPHSWHVIGAGDLPSDPDYRRGLFSIQSESSMLAALAVGVKPGMNIVDACAAPGGKTALMAEMMHGAGRVYAYELHDHRVELIRKTALRLRLYNIRPVPTDATILRPENEGVMDAVLLDAPCSGVGVMTSKPDLKYRLRDEKIEPIVAEQKKLLDACCRYVKVGGTLVYSTCTLFRAENGGQIAAFLERHPEFELIQDDGWLPDKLKPLFENGMIQLLAHRDQGMEGFFIARLRRVR